MKLYKSRSDSHQPKPHLDHRHHQNKIIPPEDNHHRDYCKRGLLPLVLILVAILMNLTALVLVSRLLKDSQLFNGFSAVVSDTGSDQPIPLKVSEDGIRPGPEKVPKLDKLLGGLLHPGFNERSCLSRYESVQYLKELKRRPSSSLISKLRSYEARHRRCGPYTESYNKSVELITSGERPFAGTDCKYVVWIPFNGLGNRILSLASTFLYAIVTNRVVLVAPMDHVPDLFCEPFPGTSWFLPEDFPATGYFNGFDQNSGYCYGNLVKNNLINKSNESKIPPFIFLNLKYNMDHYDELFFKDEDQKFLQKIPWLSMKSDQYFIPYLFLMQSFKKDVGNMFPDKESVFHLLVRYLFHPTNPVWKLIIRYHQAYLAGADEKIGIQVRVFDDEPGPFKHVLDQILGCTMSENILPLINVDDPKSNIGKKNKTKAVLITSLNTWYADTIRDIYLQYPTETGEVIRVHQPSHEERQKENDGLHYAKALAEMYLLGMSDRLVTSGESTFGYVAQGLGGLRSWVLYKPENRTAPDPPCRPFISVEPCFHSPPLLDNSTAALVPHVRPCEDRIRGLKLYPDNK